MDVDARSWKTSLSGVDARLLCSLPADDVDMRAIIEDAEMRLLPRNCFKPPWGVVSTLFVLGFVSAEAFSSPLPVSGLRGVAYPDCASDPSPTASDDPSLCGELISAN